MSALSGRVFVVDDELPVLKALERLLGAAGLVVSTFRDPAEFLAAHDEDVPGCVLLDLAMPTLDGMTLQQELAASGQPRAIVFLTGHGDIEAGIRAMKAGAVDFLTKPVSDDVLLDALHRAIEKDRLWREERAERKAVEHRIETLTRREREVMELVTVGRLNKQIAAELGTVEKTVKVHRARMMEKMGVRSVAALVHLTERIGQWPRDRAGSAPI